MVCRALDLKLTWVFWEWMMYRFTCYIALIFIMVFLPFISNAQKTNGLIVLNDRQFSFLPKEFYVAGIVDDRDERNAVALLIPKGQAAGSTDKYELDIKGGT